jgi:hypothetical protein
MWCACSLVVGLPGCILADPLPEETAPPTRRPAIAHGSVSPPASAPLVELPDEFIVPLDMSNPQVPFEWRLFIDYDAAKNTDGARIQSGVGAGSDTASKRQTVTFSVDRDLWPGPCHRIELVVALRFVGTHEADAAGFDSITWFYAPSGNFAACSDFFVTRK